MIEAPACGTPVLAFPRGAAPEIVDDGRTGYLCDDERVMADRVAAIDRLDRRACRVSAQTRFSTSRLVERNTIELLVDAGVVVVCAGGGGIPVALGDGGALRGVEAVVDKDRSAALLARDVNADVLVLLTDAEGVIVNWGTPEAKLVRRGASRGLAGAGVRPRIHGPEGRRGRRLRRIRRRVGGARDDRGRGRRAPRGGRYDDQRAGPGFGARPSRVAVARACWIRGARVSARSGWPSSRRS